MDQTTTVIVNREKTLEILQGSFWDAKRTARIADSETGAGVGQRIFTGQEYDAGTGLYYENARYYNPNNGRFTSEDPSFLAVGSDSSKLQYLEDPQALNAYAYSRNNPIIYLDPNGQNFVSFLQSSNQYNPLNVLFSSPSAEIASGIQNHNFSQASNGAVNVLAGAALLTTTPLELISGDPEGLEQYSAEQDEYASELQMPAEPEVQSSANSRLPDSAIVCRGGGCEVGSFQENSKVYIEKDPNAVVNRVSVNSAEDKSADELYKGLPQSKIGSTSVGVIRNAGGDVISQPTANNQYHAVINGLNNNQLNSIFGPTVRINPNK